MFRTSHWRIEGEDDFFLSLDGISLHAAIGGDPGPVHQARVGDATAKAAFWTCRTLSLSDSDSMRQGSKL